MKESPTTLLIDLEAQYRLLLKQGSNIAALLGLINDLKKEKK